MSDLPHAYRCHRDLTFCERPTGPLQLDLYLPPAREARPALVIFIHGGSWRSHSRADFEPRWLPAEADFAVASISYRFSPVAAFPAQIHDAKAAVRWLRAHADELGVDATRVGVIGSSAGGHLALLLGLTAGQAVLEDVTATPQPHPEQSSAVQAVVAFHPPTDFPAAGDFYERRPGKKPDPPGREPVAMLLHGTVADRPQLARLASPVLHAHHEAAPCLLLHGTDDLLVPFDQSVRMEQALQRVGAAVQLVAVDGADHGFDKTPWMSRCWSFLRLHMQRT